MKIGQRKIWKHGNVTITTQKLPLLDDKIFTLGDLKTHIVNPADSTKILIGSKIIGGPEKSHRARTGTFFSSDKSFNMSSNCNGTEKMKTQ